MTKLLTQRSRRLSSFVLHNGLRWLLLIAACVPATAMAQAALTVEFTPAPASSYLPGDTKGITLKFSNTGDGDASLASMTLTLPADVSVSSRSCSVTAGPAGSLCGTLGTGAGGGLYTDATIKSGGVLTIGAILAFDANATGDKEIIATGLADAVPDATDSHTFLRTPNTDLSVLVTAESTSPVAGATFNWACVVSAGAALCPSAAGTGPLTGVGIASFPAGGALTYTVTVNHATTDVYPTAGINAAIALPTTPAGLIDTNTSNNSHASTARTRNAAANVKTTTSRTLIASPANNCPDGAAATYTPGCLATYRVEVTNTGPDAADGSSLELLRSEAAAAAFQWTCTASGGTSCPATTGEAPLTLSSVGNFPKDGKLTFDIAVSHTSAELYESAGITAKSYPPSTGLDKRVDIDLADNESAVSGSVDRRAAIRVQKRALTVENNEPLTSIFANAEFQYEVTVYNDGPSDVGNGVLGSGNAQAIDSTGPALFLADPFDALLTGVSVPDCSVALSGEPCWQFCESTLGLGEGQVIADSSQCDVANLHEGRGTAISQRFALRAGTGSRLRTVVKVGNEVSQVVNVNNTATVSLSTCAVGDPTCKNISLVEPNTLSASVDVEVHPSASTVIDVKNAVGSGDAVPGLPHSYTITVSNMGLYNLSSAQISSQFPIFTALPGGSGVGFISGTVFYQCLAEGGAACSTVSGEPDGQANDPTPPKYGDALAVNANLPHGSKLVFTVTGELDPRATGSMSLSAGVEAAPAPFVTDSVVTSMQPAATLALTKRLYKREEQGGVSRLFYELVASNNGPSFVGEAALQDGVATVSAVNFDFSNAQWSCQAVPAAAPAVAPEATKCSAPGSGTGGIEAGSLSLDLMPGGRAVVRLDDVETTSAAGAQVENIATLSHALDSKTARVITTLQANYELRVEKDDGLTVAHPGSEHTYSITVVNDGPDDAYDVHVEDVMPSMLQNVNWTCSASSPVPGDLSALQLTVDPTPSPADALATSRDGRHIYVIGKVKNASNDMIPAIHVYARNATPGLGFGAVGAVAIDTEINGVDDSSDTGSVVTSMDAPIDLALSVDQSVLYVLSKAGGQGRIVVFHRVSDMRNPEFGRLSFAGFATSTLTSPRRITTTPTHIYVTGSLVDGSDGKIEIFKPDSSNQLPLPVTNGVVAAPVSAGPMVIDAGNSTLYVASTLNSRVRRYAIAIDGPNAGLLTQNAETDYQTSGYTQISDLLLAPNGRDLYVRARNGSNNSLIGHVRSDAAGLAFVANYGANSSALLNGAVRITLSPDGEHLLGVNRGEDALFSMRRNVLTGALSGGSIADPDMEQVVRRSGANLEQFGGLDQPTALVITPDNRHVLVTSGSTTGAIGPLTVLSRRAPAPQLGFIERDRDGDPTENQSHIDTLVAPADLATRGSFVYVLSKVDSAVTLFTRRLTNIGPEDEDGGHLSYQATWRNGQNGVSGMANPDRLLISPDGKSLFVSSVDGNSIAVFRRDTSTGTLTFARAFQASGNPGLSGAFGMAMDPASKNLYVAGSYASSIAIFSHDAANADRLAYVGAVVSGQNGVTGLNGIRDLVVTGQVGGSQVLGVSDAGNSVVVFDRKETGSTAGTLQFVQALALGGAQRPMSLALSPDINGRGNSHVYVAAQNSNTVYVIQRVFGTGGPQDGWVRNVGSVKVGSGAPQTMSGPRDVSVSPNGKRVYVTGEFGHSLVAFDRYDNPTSTAYGQLTFAEARTQDVDAVDGIRAPYAVAVSDDSRNVYVAGFDSDAVASFSVGTGSFCSASGTGDIDDMVTIRAGGAVAYTVVSTIRADATGILHNTARATVERRSPLTGENVDVIYEGEKDTPLITSAQLELTKTNNQVAVVPGTEVTYDITVRNAGPGNVTGLSDPSLANVTDLFDCKHEDGNGVPGAGCTSPPFDLDSISWTCSATGSGVLDFLAGYRDGEAGISGLGGISSLALIPGFVPGAGNEVRGNFLAGASVDDDAVVFFQRDASTGALSYYPQARIDHTAQTPLQGARSVAVSADGKLLFVVSRQSDSLNVFSLTGSAAQSLITTRLATVKDAAIRGLDKALHVLVLPAAGGLDHVYVAGANDHAVAAFTFDRGTNALTHAGSWVNGQAGVQSLADVEYLIASPDGSQVYALSGSAGSIAQFNRDPSTGELTYISRFPGGGPNATLDGVSSGVFSSNGRYLYLTAARANRLVQLERVIDSAAGNFGALSAKFSIGQDEQGTQGLVNPRRVAISPDEQHLYVTAQAGSTLAWFALHPDTGQPTYLGIRSNQSAGVAGLSGATGLVIDPLLNQIYVAGTLDRAITHFQRKSDSWCPPNGTGVLNGVPVNIAAHGEVTFRVTARVSSELNQSLINIADVNWRSASCTGNSGTTLDDCDKNAGDEDQISASANLSISKDDGLAEFDGLAGASAIAADARNIYIAAPDDNAIGMFKRRPVDAGTPGDVGLRYLGVMRSGIAGVSGLAGVIDLVASADGDHVYAVSPTDGALTAFARDSDGRLSFIEKHQNGILGVTGMMGARAVTLSPDGAHVYVAGGFSNSVAIFKRETPSSAPDYGALRFVGSIQSGIGGVSGIDSPRGVLVSPNGEQVYVLGGTGTVVVFSRQTNSGSTNFGKLTQLWRYQNASGGVLGMDDVRSMVLGADGKNLYVLGAEAGSLVHFARDTADGKLSFVPKPVVGGSLLVPDLLGAVRLRMATDGHLYAASAAQNAIAVFELDANGIPALQHVLRQGDQASGNPDVDGLNGVRDVALVNDVQNWLYAASSTDSAVSLFAADTAEPGYLGSVFDGTGGVAPGESVTYTIVVENHGPSDVAEARVVDTFPAEFEQISWTCSSSGGAACPSNGQGNLNQKVSLPMGGKVQFSATGIVRAQASGRLINTATVEALGVLDPDMTDNSATDDDTVLSPRMDLSISVDDDGCDHSDPGCTEVTQATPGGAISYRVVAANAGPTYAKNAVISDTLPAALYDVAWTCSASPQAGVLSEVSMLQATYDTGYHAVAIDPLGRHVYAVGLRDQAGIVRDTVVLFERNPLNGALSRISSYSETSGPGASPVRGISGANDVVVSRDGRFVYVAGHDADAIAVFERDLADGTLTWRSMVKDSEQGVSGIGGVTNLELSPDGKHLFAAGGASKAIAGFAINATSGALNQVSVIRQSDGYNGFNGVSDLAFNAAGDVLFASAAGSRSVIALRRNPATGVLTYLLGIEDGEVGVDASLLSPSALAIAGDRVFVADAQGDAVSLLRFIDGDVPRFDLDHLISLDSDGVNGTQQPIALAFVADQARLYVASAASSELHLYSLLGDVPESLASYGTSTSAALNNVSGFVLSPDEQQIHAVSGSSGRINTLARNPGSRCPLAGRGGLEQQRVEIAPNGTVQFEVAGRIFANATGSLTYAVAVDPRVLAHDVDLANNRATDVDTLVPLADLKVDKLRQTPDLEVIAGLPVSWQIQVQNLGISDALSAQVSDDLPIFPTDNAGLTADSGTWECSINVPFERTQYLASALEPAVADLTALTSMKDGRRWFGISRSRGALIEVSLDPGGVVSSVETVLDAGDIAELAGATDVQISPDGAYLYVTSTDNDVVLTGNDLTDAERGAVGPLAAVTGNLLVFAIGDGGIEHVQTLTSGVGSVVGLRGARQVITSGDGRYVYAAAVPSNINSSSIALFRRDADSGELSFVERVQDGLGTLGSESNVIRDIRRLHLTADGRHLYVLSQGSTSQAFPQQQALARFELDANNGKMRFVEVMRAVNLGSTASVLPALQGARDFIATPGDTGLYVLAEQGIIQFARALNGSLAQVAIWPYQTTVPARSIAMDVWGARLYVVDAQATVHLYTRQWNDGSLRHLYSLPAITSAEPDAVLHVGPLAELLVAQRGTEGGLTRLAERAVSRCMQAEGDNADLPANVDLGMAGWTHFDYTGTVHPSARGTLVNVARAVLADGVDPDPVNSEGRDEALILVQSDLSISKTGPADAVAGEYIQYVIRVDNAGPSDALGIHVKDDLDPARFQGATWTCAVEGDGDSVCGSASGAGNTLDVPADLHVGDTLVVTLTVKVNPAWLGVLQNAAYVVPEPGSVDPTPDDQVATPVDTIVVRRADVAVTKTTTVAEVVAGAAVTYTVTVHNAGPSDAPDVEVRDSLPSGLRDAQWTCTAQLGNGDCGHLFGTGSINQRVSIPVGETLSYQISALLSQAATGNLTNTAKATVMVDPTGDVLDPDLNNNSASVTNPVLQRADLSLSATVPDAFDPASSMPMPYRIEVANLGPSNAALSVVALQFNHTIKQSNAACTPQQGTQFTCSMDALNAGSSVTFDLDLRELPSVPATLTGHLSVGSQTTDPVPTNNVINTTTEMRTGVDMEITIDDGRDGLAPGDPTRYTIKVRNVGSVEAINARVLVPLANELIAASWQCTAPLGAICGANGNGGIDDLINLPAGSSLTYTLDATLDPAIDSVAQDFYEQTAEVEAHVNQVEVSTQNNAASDTNDVYKVIFKDGFEEPIAPRPSQTPLSLIWSVPLEVVPMPDVALPPPPARASARRFFDRTGGLS